MNRQTGRLMIIAGLSWFFAALLSGTPTGFLWWWPIPGAIIALVGMGIYAFPYRPTSGGSDE